MDELEQMLNLAFLSSVLSKLHEDGEMEDFLKFAREKAKEDNMDSDSLMEFFDFLENIENEDTDDFDWIEIADTIQKETGCELTCFRGDNTVIIANEKISDSECLEYLETKESKIHIGKINKALKPLNVKLEFIEALNLPFEFYGFSNFVRFGVEKL